MLDARNRVWNYFKVPYCARPNGQQTAASRSRCVDIAAAKDRQKPLVAGDVSFGGCHGIIIATAWPEDSIGMLHVD